MIKKTYNVARRIVVLESPIASYYVVELKRNTIKCVRLNIKIGSYVMPWIKCFDIQSVL